MIRIPAIGSFLGDKRWMNIPGDGIPFCAVLVENAPRSAERFTIKPKGQPKKVNLYGYRTDT